MFEFIFLLTRDGFWRLRLALLGGVGGFFNQLRKDRVAPDIKTVTLLLETSASNLLQEKVSYFLANNGPLILRHLCF